LTRMTTYETEKKRRDLRADRAFRLLERAKTRAASDVFADQKKEGGGSFEKSKGPLTRRIPDFICGHRHRRSHEGGEKERGSRESVGVKKRSLRWGGGGPVCTGVGKRRTVVMSPSSLWLGIWKRRAPRLFRCR